MQPSYTFYFKFKETFLFCHNVFGWDSPDNLFIFTVIVVGSYIDTRSPVFFELIMTLYKECIVVPRSNELRDLTKLIEIVFG